MINVVPIPKDGDGDDGKTSVIGMHVEIAVNGYILTVQLDDGEEYKELFMDSDLLLKEMRKNL